MPRTALAIGFALIALGGSVGTAQAGPRLTDPLTDEAAWKRLPAVEKGGGQTLSVWARILADHQPITTARMLELDALHRTGDRLDARLRAVARWAAADANRSPYGKAMASADLVRAGGNLEDLPRDGVKGRLAAVDRLAATFARNMMLDAASVTDAEVEKLIDLLGEERMMALVALVAHASFQDRIFLALNVEPEPGGVPPPVTARFTRPKPKAPGAPAPKQAALEGDSPTVTDDWLRGRKGLDEQLKCPGRIRVPSREEVTLRLGEGHPGLWQSAIVWSRVAYGYQPELTDAWFDCAGAFRQESSLDSEFLNSVFWVVTDSLNCFY